MAITDYHERKQAMKDVTERVAKLYGWIDRDDVKDDFVYDFVNEQLRQIINELLELEVV